MCNAHFCGWKIDRNLHGRIKRLKNLQIKKGMIIRNENFTFKNIYLFINNCL